MKKIFGISSTVNILGAAGYVLLLASWVFFVTVTLVLALDPTMNSYPTGSVYSPPVSPSAPSPLTVVAGYLIAAVMAVLTIVILVALPYLVGKWGSRVLRRLMLIFNIPISRRQMFLMKSIIATLPLVGFMVINFMLVPQSFTFAAMYITTVALSVLSIGLFLVQLFVARRLKIPVERIW